MGQVKALLEREKTTVMPLLGTQPSAGCPAAVWTHYLGAQAGGRPWGSPNVWTAMHLNILM